MKKLMIWIDLGYRKLGKFGHDSDGIKFDIVPEPPLSRSSNNFCNDIKLQGW